jgi:hypothetical protein
MIAARRYLRAVVFQPKFVRQLPQVGDRMGGEQDAAISVLRIVARFDFAGIEDLAPR